MGPGWNLGNTFDNHQRGFQAGYGLAMPINELEVVWLPHGTPPTTRAIIDAAKAAGFTSIRIPVTWYKVVDPNNNFTIRAEWMARVKEVVDWAVANDMYIILNVHHDESQLPLGVIATGSRQGQPKTDAEIEADRAQATLYLTRMWEQIADTFKGYNQKLIFEGLNEPRTVGTSAQFSGGHAVERESLNLLNQAFVDTVRKSGGNNTHRILSVPTLGASAERAAFDGFKIPADTVPNRIALSIHTYSPDAFCFSWGNMTTFDPANESHTRGIDNALNVVQTNAERLNVPVILGEWGSTNKGNEPERAKHAEYYAFAARSRGMALLWWDDASHVVSTASENYGIICRSTARNLFPDLVSGIISGYARGKTAHGS
jgi:endoglucanase